MRDSAAMSSGSSRSTPDAAAPLGLPGHRGGALVAGLGSVLDWVVLGFRATSAGPSTSGEGVDVWEGKVVLAAAVLSLVGTSCSGSCTAPMPGGPSLWAS